MVLPCTLYSSKYSFPPCSSNSKFDSLLGSKVVETLYHRLDEEGMAYFLSVLQQYMAQESSTQGEGVG